ncbi:c-Myc-binding protein homolog [Episyrphus balteatus]|uniref:c-Myc-binding protein homolog n=1 Tax=Episyrphus balteatus TaxID=286459 RepID=UPI0024852592|nr:c-Myc-binding protein homolog [Episyrphus balteatus]
MFINECSEEKKAKFVKYLEKHGVIQKFTDIFDKLMKSKEKPANPIDFIREELGDVVIPEETIEELERELEEAHREIASLQKSIEELDEEEMCLENEEVTTEVDAGPSSSS